MGRKEKPGDLPKSLDEIRKGMADGPNPDELEDLSEGN
jgi:hypothetical protein